MVGLQHHGPSALALALALGRTARIAKWLRASYAEPQIRSKDAVALCRPPLPLTAAGVGWMIPSMRTTGSVINGGHAPSVRAYRDQAGRLQHARSLHRSDLDAMKF